MLSIDKYERAYGDVLHIRRMCQYAWICMFVFVVFGIITAPFSPQFQANPTLAVLGLASGVVIVPAYFAIAVGAMRLSKLYAAFAAVFTLCFVYVYVRLASSFFGSDQDLPVTPLDWVAAAVFIVSYSYFIIVSFIALFRIVFAKRGTRRLLSDIPPDLPWSVALVTRTLGIPTSLKNVGRRKAAVLALFFVASAGYSLIALSSVAVLPIVPLVLNMEKKLQFDAERFNLNSDQNEPVDEGFEDPFGDEEALFRTAPNPFTSLYFVLAATGFAVPIASAARAAGRRLARSSIQSVQSLDNRAPILFLRAFGDDQVQLAKARQRLIAAPFTFGHRKSTLDVLLLEEGTDYGPVVALGNPKDPIPPYGAARGYFKDEDWQSAVERLANDSQAIVICVDDTDGVWWEVDLIAKRSLAQKTLFLLHPRYKDTKSNSDLCSRLRDTLSMTIDASKLQALQEQAGTPIVGFYFDAGEMQVARSRSFSLVAYMLTLRSFQRAKLKAA